MLNPAIHAYREFQPHIVFPDIKMQEKRFEIASEFAETSIVVL